MKKQLLFYLLASLFSLNVRSQAIGKSDLFSLEDYTGSAHELALAVKQQQTGRIQKLIAADTSLANVQDSRFGVTLLQYAVISGLYKATEALLKNGANPNLRNAKDGRAPIHEAANKYLTSKFLQLLLAHGGNPNLETNPVNPQEITTTPLIEAVEARLESVKLLLNAGANINYVTRKGLNSALGTAITFEHLQTAQFLLFEKKADFGVSCGETVRKRILYISDVLRNVTPKIDSEEWQQKQQILKFLQERGVDYKSAPIPYRVRHSFGQQYIAIY